MSGHIVHVSGLDGIGWCSEIGPARARLLHWTRVREEEHSFVG